MSNTQKYCFCWHTTYSKHATISFLFLLLSSLTTTLHNKNLTFMAEGRAISNTKLIESAQRSGRINIGEESKVVQVVVGMRGRQIGSRPPRCERRCGACGHCEAVQVPVTPQLQNDRRRRKSRRFSSKSIKNVVYSRGNDVSNYKPMSWKCKCGDFLFNP